jgi:hypothetical protein
MEPLAVGAPMRAMSLRKSMLYTFADRSNVRFVMFTPASKSRSCSGFTRVKSP